MSKEEAREYTEFKAPVTGWDFLLRTRWFWFLIILIILLVIFQASIPASLWYGLLTFVAVFVVSYLWLGLPEGFALDTTTMADGWLGLQPLTRFQLERLQADEHLITFPSDMGTVVLSGHRLLSLNEDGDPRIHPLLEVITNSTLANKVAESQASIIEDYLLFTRNAQVEANTQFMKEWTEWRKLRRQDPESLIE